MRKNYIFTSESVSEGHPDKVSDRISDVVVDHFISKDPFARVACETLTTTNKVVLSGEVRGPVQEDSMHMKYLLHILLDLLQIEHFDNSGLLFLNYAKFYLIYVNQL